MLAKTSSRSGTAIIAAAMLVSAAPGWAADPQAGALTYKTQCAQCHGPKGEGVMPGAPKFNRGERLLQPDTVLMATILRGKNAMPAFNGILREREVLDVIAHLRTLQR